MTSGHAGVCWKPPPGQGSADAQKEIGELVGDGFRHAHDSFDYGWLLLDDPDLEELVTKIHMANSTLQENGWGPQLLVSVFGFVPGPDAPDDARAFRLLYLFKRGTFYPFAPVDAEKERRDTELELRIRSMVGRRPPVRARPEPLVPHVGHAGLVTADAPERLIALEGAVNFRDLGGYAADGGQRTRWRPLFRADGLGELTEADLSVLRGARHPDSRRPSLGRANSSEAASTSTRTRSPSTTSPSSSELPDAEEFDRQPGPARLAVPGDPRATRVSRSWPRSRSWPDPTRSRPCSTAPRARIEPASSPRSYCRFSAWTSRQWWPTTP